MKELPTAGANSRLVCPAWIGKLTQFCLVGGTGVFVDMGILFLLADPRMLGWPVTISKVLAAEVAMLNNFAWNELWTFRERTGGRSAWRSRGSRLIKFNLICSGGILIAVMTLRLLVERFGANLYVANFLAIVVATSWNFGINYTYNWRPRYDAHAIGSLAVADVISGSGLEGVITCFEFIFPVAFAAALCACAPLQTGFQFGGDEGSEFMKSFLFSRGYSLYRRIWNDQPPLHTLLLGNLFRVFGARALVGRLLAVGFATLLVSSFYSLVRNQLGRAGAMVAVVLLIASPHFVELSVSTMIELPAMALALAGVALWFKYVQSKRTHWLALSGVLIGCALQTKFTSAIVIPAMLTHTFSSWRSKHLPSVLRKSAKDAKRAVQVSALWLSVIAVSFGFIAWLSGEKFDVFWNSHFSAETKAAVAGIDMYAFRPNILLSVPESLTSALVGMVFVVWCRRWDLLFPVILLGTVFLIHLFHRPYWYYYQLHFEIPMAWLAAIGIISLIAAIWRCDWRDFKHPPFKAAWGLLIWSALVSLVVVDVPLGLKQAFQDISSVENSERNPIVQWMKKHGAEVHWVFTDVVIYAFQAGLPVPPEVAVIPAKRIWSQQITPVEILHVLQGYKPEAIVLFHVLLLDKSLEQELHQFLDADYVLERHGQADCYLLKRANSKENKQN